MTNPTTHDKYLKVLRTGDIQAYLKMAEMALSEARRATAAATHVVYQSESVNDTTLMLVLGHLSRTIHDLRMEAGGREGVLSGPQPSSEASSESWWPA